MRAIVTGAAGFVGSHLTDLLLSQGHEVLALDQVEGPNLREASSSDGYQIRLGDVRDEDYVKAAIADGVDVVYHLAAVVGVNKYLTNPFDVLDINILGTRNVLLGAAESGTRVVVASTSEVFGKNPKIPWAEDDDRVLGSTSIDRWSYSTSKATCEHLALALHRQGDVPVSIVRYFNAYGPRQSPIYAVSRAVHRVLHGERPLLYDGGEQTRCFTYIGDVVAGTAVVGSSDDAIGEVFNLGNMTENTIRELTEIILEVTGSDLGWEDFSTAEHFGSTYQDIPRRVPDSTKAERMLGWKATTPLADGVRQTVEWARNNPEWLAIPMASASVGEGATAPTDG